MSRGKRSRQRSRGAQLARANQGNSDARARLERITATERARNDTGEADAVAEIDGELGGAVSRPIPPELLPPPIDVKENTITRDDLPDTVSNHQSIWGSTHLMRSDDDGETYRCGADGCRTAVRVVGDPGIEEW